MYKAQGQNTQAIGDPHDWVACIPSGPCFGSLAGFLQVHGPP